MSVNHLIIEERSRDIGNFMVGRLLPFRKKRMVGPFIFMDHMGPSLLQPGNYLDVDQHPHIGLSTLTYLLEGEIIHTDSIGTQKRIVPGSVNLMTAGKGVTHTERTPEDMRDRSYTLHGYQIWIALPKNMEDEHPVFSSAPPDDLPRWKDQGADFTLLIGQAYGRKSPVPVFSHLFMVEVDAKKDLTMDMNKGLTGELGILISKGNIVANDTLLNEGQLLVAKKSDPCRVTLKQGSKVFFFGGDPFEEARYIDWNFVASDKNIIEQARKDWRNRKFPKIAGDDTYVPYPGLI